VLPRARGGHSAARGADQKALLDQKRFDHVFYGAAFLGKRCGQALDTHRAAVEMLDKNRQQPPIELVETLGIRPLLLVGHSAGAAIVIRSCVDHGLSAEGVISINGALRPFRGAAGFLYPSLAKLMFLNPWTPNIIARSATDRERVERLIHGTGSNIDEPGVDLYARLMTSPVHVASALGMVAHWDLSALDRALPRLAHPLLLVTGQRDRAVPPEDAEYARQLAPRARVSEVSGVGHLAHEEAPETVADLIFDFAGKLAGNPANEGPESAPVACSGDR